VRELFAAVVVAIFAQAQTPQSIAGRIRIERTSAGKMRFNPAEIVAWAGSQIHWYNTTAEAHDPGVIKEDGSFVAFLEEPVAAGAASAVFSPLARIDDNGKLIAFTIHYVCGRHRNEQGAIQVIPTP
jgi:plastocyanin